MAEKQRSRLEVISRAQTAFLWAAGWALDTGLLRRHYQRFVIVTTGRSGSTMLTECLAQHPQVVSRDEVFHKDRVFDRWRHCIWENSPITYLDHFEFRWFAPAVRAVGFVIHYYHCQSQQQQPVWQYLADSDINIIHLKRNLLDVFVDIKIAQQTGVYNARSEEEAQSSRNATIHVDYDKCRAYLEYAGERRQALDRMFSRSTKIDLWYEDLVAGFEAEIRHIEDWLGVDRQPLVPRTVRQVSRPMSQVITNYTDLRRRFEGTPWISCFDKPQTVEADSKESTDGTYSQSRD